MKITKAGFYESMVHNIDEVKKDSEFLMLVKNKFVISFILYFIFLSFSLAKENYYDEAKNKFDEKELEVSKFLFQKNIVFNPKDAKSYLYLAKIFNLEANEKEEEKNLDTTLLLDPANEEAMYMLINIKLKNQII